MYTMDTVARKIKAMGATAFIEMISSPLFSSEIAEILEELEILVDGVPADKTIRQLAA